MVNVDIMLTQTRELLKQLNWILIQQIQSSNDYDDIVLIILPIINV